MENDALKPGPTYKRFKTCTTCYYNCIVGQTNIDSVPVPFYPLCCVTDADGYRPSCLLSTQLDVGGAVVEWVRESTGDRTFDGSSPTSVKTFLFGTLAIPFTPLASVFRMRQ